MKIITVHISEQGMYLTQRPDTSLLRNDEDYYLPSRDAQVTAAPFFGVRISRLAKCVSSKFASRCYESFLAGVSFRDEALVEKSLAAGISPEMAYMTDRSLALGVELSQPVGKLELRHDDSSLVMNCAEVDIAACIEFATAVLTLKIGDLLIIESSERCKATAGHSITLLAGEQTLSEFEVK